MAAFETDINPIADKDQGSSSSTTQNPATSAEHPTLPAPVLEHSSSIPTTEAVLQPGWNQNHIFPPGPEAHPAAPGDLAVSSHSSPEPCGDESQGQYIGPTSGASFLLRVQKRLHQSISVSHASNIFTFGDAPLQLPEFDPSFCMMLPRDDAQRLVDRYFDFAMPTYRFLHRATIQAWFNEFYDTLGVMRDAISAPAKIALLFMVLAQGRVYMPDDNVPGPPDLRYVELICTRYRPRNGLLLTRDVTQHPILSGSRAPTHQGAGTHSPDQRTGPLDTMLLSPNAISDQSLLESVRHGLPLGARYRTQQEQASRSHERIEHDRDRMSPADLLVHLHA